MDTMAERIKRAMLLRDGMTPAQLIEKTGLSRAGVYFLLDGTTKAEKVRAETIVKLCKALRVNRDWLLHGRGPIEGVEGAPKEPDWADVRGYAQAVGLGNGAEAQEYAETHKLKFKASSFARKRLKADAMAVFYGSGDSMEPRIHDGDAILFDTKDTKPRDGALFIIQVHGDRSEYQVKRCETLDDIVFFKADNPSGDHGWKKPRRMDAKKQPIEIIGRVRWIGSWED
jgi:DNA-binding Xre family transcriptional regulator